MTLDEFVKAFAEELEETPVENVSASTEYKKLDDLYQSMSFNLEKFVQEYAKSSKDFSGFIDVVA